MVHSESPGRTVTTRGGCDDEAASRAGGGAGTSDDPGTSFGVVRAGAAWPDRPGVGVREGAVAAGAEAGCPVLDGAGGSVDGDPAGTSFEEWLAEDWLAGDGAPAGRGFGDGGARAGPVDEAAGGGASGGVAEDAALGVGVAVTGVEAAADAAGGSGSAG